MYYSAAEPPYAPTFSAMNDQIETYKNALEAVEQDFIDYQRTSQQEINDLSDYTEQLKRFAEGQRKTIERLENQNEIYSAQIQQLCSESRQMRAQTTELQQELDKQASYTLKLSIAQEETSYRSAIQSLENPRIINNQGSELAYCKSLNQQLKSESERLYYQLKQLQEELNEVKAQNAGLQQRQKQDEEKHSASTEARLRQWIQKAVVVIYALGAPFDPTTEEFAYSLRQAVMNENYCRGIKVNFQDAEVSLDTAVEQYISRGLYLLGLKTQKPADYEKPWRQVNEEALSDGTRVSDDFETFYTLIRKNNVCRERLFVLEKNFAEMKNRAETAERRLGYLSKENEALSRISRSSYQVVKSIREQVDRDRAYCEAQLASLYAKYNGSLGEVVASRDRLAVLFKDSAEQIKAVLGKQLYAQFGEELAAILERVAASQIIDEASGIAEQLKTVNESLRAIDFKPTALDLQTILEKQYGYALPESTFQRFNSSFEELHEQLQVKVQEIEKRDLVIGLLLARSSPVSTTLQPSADFAQLVDDFIRQAKNSEFYRDFAVYDLSLDEQFIIIEQQKQIQNLTTIVQELQQKCAEMTQKNCVLLRVDDKLRLSTAGGQFATLLTAVEAGNKSYRYEAYLEGLVQALAQHAIEKESQLRDAASHLQEIGNRQAELLGDYRYQLQHLTLISEKLSAQFSRLADEAGAMRTLCECREELQQFCVLQNEQFSQINYIQLNVTEALNMNSQASPLEISVAPVQSDLRQLLEAAQDAFGEIKGNILEVQAAVTADRREIQTFYTTRKTLDAERFRAAQGAIKTLEINLKKCQNELAYVRRAHVQMSARDGDTIARLQAELKKAHADQQSAAEQQLRKIRDAETKAKQQRQAEFALLNEQIRQLKTLSGVE